MCAWGGGGKSKSIPQAANDDSVINEYIRTAARAMDYMENINVGEYCDYINFSRYNSHQGSKNNPPPNDESEAEKGNGTQPAPPTGLSIHLPESNR